MKLLMIISGSIAVKRCVDLLEKLKKNNAEIEIVITKSALELMKVMNINIKKFGKVHSDLSQSKNKNKMLHIDLTRKAEAIIVCPASANIIGKFANGIADDLASTCLLSSNKKIFIAPAMNVEMWKNPSNKKNVNSLKNNGTIFIGPIHGNLACGETGMGRISNTNNIVKEIKFHLNSKKILKGLTGIVTSGPTIEKIDPIRYISNFSSGKQGYAIANSLALMGAKIKLISGPCNLDVPSNVEVINVLSANDMNNAVMDSLPVDIVICSAAVSDFKPSKYFEFKRKKNNFNKILLKKNMDILYNVSNSKNLRPSLVIGFAAETDSIKRKGKFKLSEKKCDWILANKISKNKPVFGEDDNLIHYITDNLYEKWPKMSKTQVAEKLNNKIVEYFKRIHAN